jgi:hypothetical protein
MSRFVCASVLSLSLLWGGLCVPGSACVLRWQPVTATTDGKPLAPTVVVTYVLYFQADGALVPELVAMTTETTAVRLCPAGRYWLKARAPGLTESAASTQDAVVAVPGTDTEFKRGQP